MYQIAIDGGCRDNKLSASACTIEYISDENVLNNSKKIKLVVLLEDCSPLKSELISLVLAFSLYSQLNNELELNQEAVLYTDSEVIKNALDKNLSYWQKNNWKNKQNKKVLNKTLWQLALEFKPRALNIQRDRCSKQVVKCHKACDWVLSSHKKFTTETFLKKPSSLKTEPWFYVDKRSFFDSNLHLINQDVLRKHVLEFTKNISALE